MLLVPETDEKKCGICVVHLVRKQNDNAFGRFERFLASYLQYEAGIEHQLLIVLKGFDDADAELERYKSLLKQIPHSILFDPDIGFAEGTYFRLADSINAEWFCFLNSNCRILADNWLKKLKDAISKKGVGMVGTCGSLASHYTAYLNRPLHEKILRNVYYLWHLNWLKNNFPPFPNYHLRTHMLMVSRRIFNQMKRWPMKTKMDTYLSESGNDGFTNQVLRLGLEVLVVDKYGKTYAKEDWANSGTIDPEMNVILPNLLIIDIHD